MEYLIDTHVCLWAIADRKKLSARVKTLLEDTNNKVFVSQVSLFEIAIKVQVGKLIELETTIAEFIAKIYLTGFEILPFKNEHVISYSIFNFSGQHKDPFDRYLAATAYFEKMAFVTKDEKFENYADRIELVW